MANRTLIFIHFFYWSFYTKINYLFCVIFFKIILAIFSDLWYYNTCKEERDKKANKKTYKKLKKFLTNLFTDDIINT